MYIVIDHDHDLELPHLAQAGGIYLRSIGSSHLIPVSVSAVFFLFPIFLPIYLFPKSKIQGSCVDVVCPFQFLVRLQPAADDGLVV